MLRGRVLYLMATIIYTVTFLISVACLNSNPNISEANIFSATAYRAAGSLGGFAWYSLTVLLTATVVVVGEAFSRGAGAFCSSVLLVAVSLNLANDVAVVHPQLLPVPLAFALFGVIVAFLTFKRGAVF